MATIYKFKAKQGAALPYWRQHQPDEFACGRCEESLFKLYGDGRIRCGTCGAYINSLRAEQVQ